MSAITASKITTEDFLQVLRAGMPSAASLPYEVVTLEHGLAVLRLTTGADALRPGGTVAGPVLFGLADLAMYAAVMTVVGKLELAVTTDATIHFLRRPRPGALVARARVLKHGQRLVIGDIVIANDGDDAPVAHVVMTYSVPPS
jgi:uncharacterized protein (TIGR00369 family)|nr:PaaI family thioesterase [Kofleriaceae bacterium]